MNETCPYSDPPFGEFTDDHIFPEFLGGRQTVRVCRDCNSRFGHSFEAKASTQLKRLQVFISHFGLDLTRSPESWPAALEVNDIAYDLKSGPDGTQYELARPLILRDGAGKIVGGRARSRFEAERIAASLIKKRKAKEVTIEQAPGENLDDVKLVVDLSYDDNLYKFSTKLVSNLAVFMRWDTLIKGGGIPQYLHGTGAWGTRIAHSDISALRGLRPGLSHTIYIEFGVQSHAIVILFGAMQVYVPLPSAAPGAILGFLDPLTGEESFRDVDPIGVPPAPQFWTDAEARRHFGEIMAQFKTEAIARGAKRPPDLSVPSYDLGSPAQFSDMSRTTTTFPGETYCGGGPDKAGK